MKRQIIVLFFLLFNALNAQKIELVNPITKPTPVPKAMPLAKPKVVIKEVEKNKDYDGDGITDDFDKCPNSWGTMKNEGCPDSDGDGIADHIDKCPNEKGVLSNYGCPEKKSSSTLPTKLFINEYIEKYKSIAINEMNIYKIPASITLGQGIIETWDGQSRLTRVGNNHFGIKCQKTWTGPTMIYEDAKDECFRVYATVEESYRDHSILLASKDRYKKLFSYDINDYKSWAYGLKECGYATVVNYPQLLVKIIEDNKLYLFDTVFYTKYESVKESQGVINMKKDSDNDGVEDTIDECPYTSGTLLLFGCPDSDNDGIGDSRDKCPFDKGIKENEGCPEKKSTIAAINSISYYSSLNIPAVKIPGMSYSMSVTEVTIGQYLAFCKATNSHWPEWLESGSKYNIYTGSDSRYKDAGMSESNTSHPITGVSWYNALAFAKWAGGRLPTEEEWEHAAKGGQSYEYAGSHNLNEVGWYALNSFSTTHPVKQKKPNGYGLYDMSGNVWEWTSSVFSPSSSERVLRGGSWINDEDYFSTSYRGYNGPENRMYIFGFRIIFP